MGFDIRDTIVGRLLSGLAAEGRGNGLHPDFIDGDRGNGDDGPDGTHRHGGPHGHDTAHGTGNPHGHDGPDGTDGATQRPQSTNTAPQTGGPAQPQSANAPPTGGPAPQGMQDVSPSIVSQLMHGARAHALPLQAEAARAAAGHPASEGAVRHGHAAIAAQATPATVAAPVTTAAPASQALSTNTVASTATPTLAQPAASVPRTLGEGLVPVHNRPADALLAARADNALLARVATALQPAPAPPTLAVPTSLAAPGSTTAALAANAPGATVAASTAAGLTMATSASQAVDARGVILPVNDRASVRLESLGLAGHTLEGLQRRSLRMRAQEMLPQQMTRWLSATGLIGAPVSDADAGPERDVQRMLQWLFWTLAIVAYGCLAVAIVALVGGGGQLFDQPMGRSYTGWLAGLGLLTGTVAWWLARRLARR